jgi:hypothetical protein
MTRNGEPHRLALHALALGVVQERREALAEAQAGRDLRKKAHILAAGVPSSGLGFPAPVSGGVLDTFINLKAKLVATTGSQDGRDARAAKLDSWTWHDFRRPFATAPGEAGISEPVVDAILNHSQSATRGGVLGVYQRTTRWPEQVKAPSALNPSEADDNKVVSMAGARRLSPLALGRLTKLPAYQLIDEAGAIAASPQAVDTPPPRLDAQVAPDRV